MAESLLRKGAEGDLVTMNNLGSLLSCRGDLVEGAQWYLSAADSGYSLAMVQAPKQTTCFIDDFQ